ncbi:riboflavin synthase subunit alpha [Paramagnetospirillum marisnigri]|uniref:Riboflavin synthase n=1 Tax=Paramagnetospirillum marisnigri TaxID=1285242 RepID=A0A178MQ49_9PROT|nr:riboflavin synthase [Paramagnetospirillum marisnigri]OAN50846.1 riboflavin synthase subunit alpha [Paramagnetospirillum marisnigri]
MFTGIVTDFGEVRRVIRGLGRETRFEIASHYDSATIAIGASIAHNGVCLTVIETGPGWHAVEASAETLSKTTLGGWVEGSRVNLERALKLGDEMGGHIVSGHVDGIATVVSITPENESKRYVFETPVDLAKFVAPKGSVALDGVSLTVNEVEGRRFGVNIIPHTQAVTTFGSYRPGDAVNMEIDMLARYVARLLERE